MAQIKIFPQVKRITVLIIMFLFISTVFAVPSYAATLDIPAGIPGAGHNVYDATCPESITADGISMKKVAVLSRIHPQGIAYGDGYFYVSHNGGIVDRIPEEQIINGSGEVTSPDKSFSANMSHGQGIAYYDGLLWFVSGGTLRGYDSNGSHKKTESMGAATDYHLAITTEGVVWNVSSGGHRNGDVTKARYAKMGSSSWDTVHMNHGANKSQASQGGDYNPATDRVAFMSNGIIMTFPAKPDMKGSDVHMFPFNCNPESEGITFTPDGKGYAILRNGSQYFVMEVELDDEKVNDELEEKIDFSFYELANRTSVEFQQAMLDGDAKDMLSSTAKTGCAGTYLGYTKGSDMTLHSLATRNTQNTVSYSYKSIDKIGEILEPGGSGTGYGFKAAAGYGRVLNDLGYDEVGTQITKTIRLLAGGLLMVAYYLGIAVPFLFGFILDFLRAFNPFALLGIGADKLASYGGSLEVLSDRFTDFYDTMYDLSLFVVLPISAALAFGIAMLSGRQAGRKSVKAILMFMFKIFMIIWSIPIIGAGYTHLLDEIDNMHVFGPESANQIVYSELVDFQGWAHNTNLNPPADLELKPDGDGAKLPKQGIRIGARKINDLAGHKEAKVNNDSRGDFVGGFKPGKSSGMEVTLTEYTYDDDQKTKDKILEVHNLMLRYAKGDVYSSSTYEGEVKEVVMKRMSEGDRSVKQMILNGSAGGRPYSSSVGTVFGNGTLKYSKASGYTPGVVDGDMLTGNRGLSSLGMFNYLTSKYDNSQMLLFGGKTSSNERVKDSHMSVTSVGSGAYGVLLYLQTVVSLFCLGIIGFVYGIGFIGISFKRGFMTIASLPGMMLGSKQFIGKFLSAAFLLFAEILITMLLYAFFTEIILVVNDAFVSIVN